MKLPLALTLLGLLVVRPLSAQTQTAVEPVTSPSSDQTVVLSPFEVQSGQDHGYSSTNAVSGTRFSVPVSDIPQSIIVINQDFLNDVGATSVLDAAQYVSGVTSTGGGERDVFLVRGYQVSVTVDGMPDGSPEAQGLTTPTETMDRVEIIKGPSAVLYGSTSAGGNVNRVEKRPLFNNQDLLEVTGGGEGYEHVMFDVNAATQPSPVGQVGVRVIGGYSHYDEYVNFRDANRYVFAPEAAWRITPKTTVTVIPYYIYDNHHKTFGNLFQYPPYGMNAPISFNMPRDVDWSTAYERESMMVHRVYASVEQEINEHWHMRLIGIVKSENDMDGDLIPLDLLPYNGGYLMPRTWRYTYAGGTYHDWAYDNLVHYDFGPVKNKTLLLLQYDSSAINSTVDTGRKLSGQDTAIGENSSATVSNMPLINILTYVPNMDEPDSKYVSAETYAYTQDFAWSAQDEVEIVNRVFLNLGVRWDHIDEWGLNLLTHAFSVSTPNPDGVGTSDHYTKRAGIVYQPLAGLSFFFNYSETFAPTFHINPDGTSLTKPTMGTTYEAGPKFDLWDGKVSGTLSVFDIKDTNVLSLSTNPVLASAGYDTQGGYNEYKGLEMDLYYNLVKNLQIIGSCSFLTPTTFNGATSTVTRVRNVSDTTVALFASYRFGSEDRWTGGAGVHYKSKQPGDTGNTFYLPSATVFDVFLKYDYTKAVTFQLNVDNLFNKYYADSSVSRDIIYAGPERRVSFSVSYRR